jgi:Protein of unknown function (DUF2852)
MTPTASATIDQGLGESSRSYKGCRTGAWRWSAGELAAMVGGFVVFWPLGLLALFVKWKNKELWPGSADGAMPWSAWKKSGTSSWSAWRPQRGYGFSSSGNAAFDDYKRQQLDRLEQERRKLEDEQRAFKDYLERLRMAKDKDEFDRFMAERSAPQRPQGDQPSA